MIQGDFVQFQALHHPLVQTDGFATPEEFCLHLIHLKAYEEAARLASGKAVLDIGCNNGYGTRILAASALRAAGVDVSERAIAAARSQNPLINLSFECVSGERLPFADGHFDVVTSFQVIEHLADYSAYLSEIIRVLKPGGMAIFTTPNAAIRLDPGMKPWFPFHIREFSSSELKELLAGWFSNVAVRGLFAIPTLYDIEYNRVQRSRINARNKARAWLPPYVTVRATIIDFVKAVLPKPVVRAVQQIVRRHGSQVQHGSHFQAAPSLPTFTTSSLYYSTENVDLALDLMAVCRKVSSDVT